MKTVVIRNIDRADAAVIERLGALGTATVHEAYGRLGLMKPYLRPVWAGGEAAGSLIGEIGFAATATLYAATGLVLMMIIALHWRADLWHVHAPANAK